MALTTTTSQFQVRNTFILSRPTSIVNYVLSANTAVDIDLDDLVDAGGSSPSVLNFQFSGQGVFFLGYNQTNISIPSSNITNGEGVEISPSQRWVDGGLNSLSVISPVAGVLSIGLFKAPS